MYSPNVTYCVLKEKDRAIAVENYELQRKPRMANRLEEDDRMYELFRQERARMIADPELRLVEVRRQAEDDRAHYMNQVQMREAEIQRLLRVLQQADRNAYESQNAARVAAEELAPAQAFNVGSVPRAATLPPQLVASPRLPLNGSPRRPTDLGPPMDLGGGGPEYDRVEDLM